ncbi:porin [Paraburkholderia antibiotica]|uniref:Porin n=1 Tax=Paraburkholderia antibiotica TaxID=2728839 RepID=A0A7X9ZZ23_9BURK|nr:porin [Paraburkholderia antibiotica]NML32305.1 porin [Paraburkholderia antibiotica]
MRRASGIHIAAFAAMATFTQIAHADNSVTLYGIIDTGIDFVNNSGGSHLWQMRDGTYAGIYGSRWGLKGNEDLGGGWATLFRIENGFSLENGQLRQGGLGFGRQAYVGLSNDRLGTVTFGRQYDSIVDYIAPTTLPGNLGGMFVHAGDIDNTSNSFRVNNSVKYASPNLGGFSFGGVYAFTNSNTADAATTGMWSAGANYSASGLTLAVGYLFARNPGQLFADGNFVPNTTGAAIGATGPFSYVGQPRNQQVIGAGATYVMGHVTVGADYTNVKFDDANGTTQSVRFDNYEVWGQYAITPAATVGGGYTFTDGKVNYNGATPKYHQIGLLLDYKLSKRTEAYLMGAFQRAAGSAIHAAILDGAIGDASSTNKQLATRIGLVHKF